MPWLCKKCNAENEDVSGICNQCCEIKSEDALLVPPLIDPDSSALKKGAGFGIRAVAVLIDTFVGVVVGFAAGLLAGATMALLASHGFIAPDWYTKLDGFSMGAFVLGMTGPFIYRIISETLTSTTLGKLICGLRVVGAEGQPITTLQALKRSLAFHWDGLFFGLVAYSYMSKGPRRQRCGDSWAGTIVVKKSEYSLLTPVAPLIIALGILAGLGSWMVIEALGVYSRLL